jgi:Family of unknown function (DUF6221)
MTMTDDLDYDPALVAWLCAQLDADEQALAGSGNLGWLTFREPNGDMRYTTAACAGPDDLWFVDGNERTDFTSATIVHREAERLADVRSKRKLIDELIAFMEGDYAPWNDHYLRLLAQPYADRAGFRDEWRYCAGQHTH